MSPGDAGLGVVRGAATGAVAGVEDGRWVADGVTATVDGRAVRTGGKGTRAVRSRLGESDGRARRARIVATTTRLTITAQPLAATRGFSEPRMGRRRRMPQRSVARMTSWLRESENQRRRAYVASVHIRVRAARGCRAYNEAGMGSGSRR